LYEELGRISVRINDVAEERETVYPPSGPLDIVIYRCSGACVIAVAGPRAAQSACE